MPAQALLVWSYARCALPLCSVALGAMAAVRRAVERASQLLSLLSLVAWLPPRPLPPHGACSAAECAAVLLFIQLTLGFALPVLVAAVSESRAWELHQAQRRAAGLPAEGGRQATLYAAIAASGVDRLPFMPRRPRQRGRQAPLATLAVCLLLTATLWEVLLLLVPRNPAICSV